MSFWILDFFWCAEPFSRNLCFLDLGITLGDFGAPVRREPCTTLNPWVLNTLGGVAEGAEPFEQTHGTSLGSTGRPLLAAALPPLTFRL